MQRPLVHYSKYVLLISAHHPTCGPQPTARLGGGTWKPHRHRSSRYNVGTPDSARSDQRLWPKLAQAQGAATLGAAPWLTTMWRRNRRFLMPVSQPGWHPTGTSELTRWAGAEAQEATLPDSRGVVRAAGHRCRHGSLPQTVTNISVLIAGLRHTAPLKSLQQFGPRPDYLMPNLHLYYGNQPLRPELLPLTCSTPNTSNTAHGGRICFWIRVTRMPERPHRSLGFRNACRY